MKKKERQLPLSATRLTELKKKIMDNDSGGYDVVLINKAADDFYCIICACLIKQATQLNCGHIMCKCCINKLEDSSNARKVKLQCPSRCKTEIYPFIAVPTFDRLILVMKVKCINTNEGCEWIGELGNMKDHQAKYCEFEKIICSFTNCNVYVCRNLLEGHQKTCEQREVVCEYCEFVCPNKEMKQHFYSCSFFPVPCPNVCGKTVLRSKVDDHLLTCLFQEVDCPFKDVGCVSTMRREELPKHTEIYMNNHLLLMMSKYKQILPTAQELTICKQELTFCKEELIRSFEEIDLLKEEIQRLKGYQNMPNYLENLSRGGIRYLVELLERNEPASTFSEMLKHNSSVVTVRGHPSNGTLFHQAVLYNRADVVKALLNAKVDATVRDNEGDTPYHWGAYYGAVESLQILLQHNSTHVNEVSFRFYTPIMWAAHKNQIDCAKLLLKHNPNLSLKNDKGKTALSLASSSEMHSLLNSYTKTVSPALKKCLDEFSKRGFIYLVELLKRNQSASTFAEMLKHNSSVVTVRGHPSNGTLFHQAVLYNRADVVKALLDAKVDASVRDNEGDTPYHWGAYYGAVESLQMLLQHDSTHVNALSFEKYTPIMWAARTDNIDCVRLLLTYRPNLELMNKDGRTVFDEATDKKHILKLLNRYAVVECLRD